MSETTEQRCLFSDDPEDGIVLISEDLADVEEMAPLVLDAGIARRVVRTSEWVRQERCSGCGSVLDGELCCDGRRAEIEAGEAVLAAASAPLVCTCTPSMRSAGRRCGGCIADDNSAVPVSPGEATPPTTTVDFDEAVGSALRAWRGLTIIQRDQWERYPWPEAAFIASHIRTFAAGSPVAETPAEPVDLPLMLRSVDDVRQVCDYAGLDESTLITDTWRLGSDFEVEASEQGWNMALGSQGADLDYGWPSSLLLAAIQAARGETDAVSKVVRREQSELHRTTFDAVASSAASPAVEGTTPPTCAGLPLERHDGGMVTARCTCGQSWFIGHATVAKKRLDDHLAASAVVAQYKVPPSLPVPAHPGVARPADGAALIAAERARQTAVEGWTPEHDDEHAAEQLASAAACYALPSDSRRYVGHASAPWYWPWATSWWKPCPDDRVRELVKAGALIAAEIDRLSRVRALLTGGDQ